MKTTVVICDNCHAQFPEDEWGGDRIKQFSQDWCPDCIHGRLLDLMELPFHVWPKRITKASVQLVLEAHEKRVADLREQLKEERRKKGESDAELGRVRRNAAEAYASENRPQEALKDIATGARREGTNGE